MAKLNFLFTFFIVVFISTFNFAQDKFVQKTDTAGVYKLSDVVVTATKTNTNILELANSITVIDSIEIANRNKTNVFNLLQTEYGLSSIQFGPGGGLSTINIRGANAGLFEIIFVSGIIIKFPAALVKVCLSFCISEEKVYPGIFVKVISNS